LQADIEWGSVARRYRIRVPLQGDEESRFYWNEIQSEFLLQGRDRMRFSIVRGYRMRFCCKEIQNEETDLIQVWLWTAYVQSLSLSLNFQKCVRIWDNTTILCAL
jgi:hypothetical protein